MITLAPNSLHRSSKCTGKIFSFVYTVEDHKGFEALSDRTANKPKMTNFNISLATVTDKLAGLAVDKSPGTDLLHPRVLYEVRHEIAGALVIIFNKSIEEGSVPEDWKEAEVIALYKKGARSERGNYRPVSLTSICCKILESFIHDHIMKYILTNDLLTKKQYSFVKGRSTVLQLLHMLDNWTEYLDKGGEGQIDAMRYIQTLKKPLIKFHIKDYSQS